MQPAAVTPYSPAAYVPRPGRRARRRAAAGPAGVWPLVAVSVLLTVAVTVWLGWRARGVERDIAALRARIVALSAERSRLEAEVARLGERSRVERLAAARGLFPLASAQKVVLKR